MLWPTPAQIECTDVDGCMSGRASFGILSWTVCDLLQGTPQVELSRASFCQALHTITPSSMSTGSSISQGPFFTWDPALSKWHCTPIWFRGTASMVGTSLIPRTRVHGFTHSRNSTGSHVTSIPLPSRHICWPIISTPHTHSTLWWPLFIILSSFGFCFPSCLAMLP